MKTRVVRYWHHFEWLYKVEQYIQVKPEDIFIGPSPRPENGSWRWAYVCGPTSEANCKRIAQELTIKPEVDHDDVVAEYGA